MIKRFWTVKEIEILKQRYPNEPTQNLVNDLGRTYTTVSQKAKHLNIKKSDEYLKKMFEKTNKNFLSNGCATRFQKGQISHNKGKKQADYMSAENIEKSKVGRFKKGLVPHNYKPIGSERITIDGYTEVKVGDNSEKNRNYKLKNRLIYERVYGEIPKDCVIQFVDGDKQNFDIHNLICRTKKENINDNILKDSSIIKQQFKIKNPAHIDFFKENAQDIIQLKRSEMLLNRKINEHTRTAGCAKSV